MQLRKYCPYDVGDYYITENAGDPSEKWAGTTWQRVQDVMLMAAGATYAVGATGGSATHTHTTGNCTLTVDQMPSHTHSVGAHAHGLNSHTHTYAKPNTPTGGTAITVAQLASHNHQTRWASTTNGSTNGLYAGMVGTQGGFVTGNTGSGSAHTHTIGTTSTNSGAASGNTANSAAFNSGAASGNTADSAAPDSGATGGGKAFSILNPCLAVYMWKRVA